MIIKQHRIYRADLQANPHVLYVFGDNLLRGGMGGQAGEMRGEPNAIGVATKISPGNGEEDYFSDAQYEDNINYIGQDLFPIRQFLLQGRLVVWPLDGIGTGLSEMPQRCPRTFKFIEDYLERWML